jgi:hypothetical protein
MAAAWIDASTADGHTAAPAIAAATVIAAGLTDGANEGVNDPPTTLPSTTLWREAPRHGHAQSNRWQPLA